MASGQTTNLKLPIFASGDVPNWNSDWNSAMKKIDDESANKVKLFRPIYCKDIYFGSANSYINLPMKLQSNEYVGVANKTVHLYYYLFPIFFNLSDAIINGAMINSNPNQDSHETLTTNAYGNLIASQSQGTYFTIWNGSSESSISYYYFIYVIDADYDSRI